MRLLELDTFSKEMDVMWRGFVISVIAAVSLQYIDPFGTKKLVLFGVNVTLLGVDSWADSLPLGQFRDRRRVAGVRTGTIPASSIFLVLETVLDSLDYLRSHRGKCTRLKLQSTSDIPCNQGALGSLLIKLNVRIAVYRRNSVLYQWPVLEVVGVSAITAAVSYLVRLIHLPNKYGIRLIYHRLFFSGKCAHHGLDRSR